MASVLPVLEPLKCERVGRISVRAPDGCLCFHTHEFVGYVSDGRLRQAEDVAEGEAELRGENLVEVQLEDELVIVEAVSLRKIFFKDAFGGYRKISVEK